MATSSENNGFDKAPLLRLSDALTDFDRDADAAYTAKQTGEPRGPQTGLPNLDRAIGYAMAPGLHGVHGNTGAGKTAFAMQLASHCGFPALFVTCEMAPGELLRRHTARETKTYLGRFKSGELSPDAAHALALRAIQAAPHLALLDATVAPATPDHIRDCARVVQGDAKSVLIVVDSLHTWAESLGADGGEYEALNSGIKALRVLSRSLDVPILFISERNRDSMKSGGTNAGAGSRKIEYGAETILELDREEEAKFDGAGELEILIRIAKNRHGEAGRSYPLKFNGALQLFRELDASETSERLTRTAKSQTRGR